MAKTSKTMLNNSGESGQPCLVSDLSGNGFSFSPLRIMLAADLSNIAIIMCQIWPYYEVSSLYAYCLQGFYR